MVNSAQIGAFGEQVVLSAQYSSRRWVWGAGLIVISLIASFCSIFLIMRGNVKGFAGPIGVTIVLVWGLDLIFTDRIIFYQDRMVKIWHVLGERTIYYSRAKVLGANPREARRKKWYTISDIKDNGGRIWFQIPILYGAHFVSADTAKQIDLIIAYLTGNSENRIRTFKESYLPREVTCQTSPTDNS